MNTLVSIITTVRHGHKGDDGKLTQLGFEQAQKVGLSKQFVNGQTFLFTSGVDRVVDTVHHITTNQASKFHFHSHYLHYLYKPQNKGLLFSQWDVDKTPENPKMQNFLNQNSVSSEPEIYPSPKGMAVRIARILITQIDFATISTNQFMMNFVNGSHEPVIASFLYYFLTDFQGNSPDFIEKIGGTIQFAEGFEIFIYQDENLNSTVNLKFRNTTKTIDQKVLREFANQEIS